MSIGDLRPSSQDTSAFYLQNIYQLLSDPNRSDPTIPSTLSIPPAFSPPTYAVWVNSLWFLSLAISLTCGLQATLLQQWARRYIKITQPRRPPHERARIRAFFADGVDALHLPWAVEALPTLLHLSLFLFLAGLVVYLININHTVFTVVAWWVGLCTTTYVGVTLMPLFRNNSPYYAPLSSSAWYLVNVALYVIFKSLKSLVECFGGDEISTRFKFDDLSTRFWCRFYAGIKGVAEYTAITQSSETDRRAIQSVFSATDEDSELEQLFAVIPSFFKSTIITGQDRENIFNDGIVSDAFLRLVNRTVSSHSLSESAKRRRMSICRAAMNAASFPINLDLLYMAFLFWDEIFCSIDCGLILKAAAYNDDPAALYASRCAVSIILEKVPTRDDNWCELANSHFGVSKSVLRNYLAHGDSASLANLNCIIRRAIDGSYSGSEYLYFSDHTDKALESASKIDVQDTLPELQHDFCAIWNELVLYSQSNGGSILFRPTKALLAIRHIYVSLHQGTASTPMAFSASTANDDPVLLEPPSYPLCTEADHHPSSASHVHGDVVVTTELQARTSATMFSGGKILDSDTPTHVDALSSPTLSPYHTDSSPANRHSLDDISAAPRRIAASILAPSTPVTQISPVYDEDRPSPVNPFDSTTTLVIRNGIYTDTIEHTANSNSRTSLSRTTSTPVLPLSSISRSNRTDSSQQDGESTTILLSTFSYPPSSSIPLFTNNASSAPAFSSLLATAGDHIPTIHVIFLSPSTVACLFIRL